MDDLISRQAAIEAIQNLYPDMPETCIANILDRWYKKNKHYIECEDAINKLPSVQPEKVCIANIALLEEQVREAVEKAKSEIIQLLPSKQSERKKGKWIDKGDYCVCNQCGHTEQQFNGVELIPLHTPFCAICGAEMETDNAEDIH